MKGEIEKVSGGEADGRDDAATAAGGGEARIAPGDVAKAAAVGALAGAVVGALLRIADAETGARQLDAVKKTAVAAGRDVATAALAAATEVVARNRIGELVARKPGNGDRSAAMRNTAKEAGVAAAVAARRVLAEKTAERGRPAPERD